MTRPIVDRVQMYASMIAVFGLFTQAPSARAQTQSEADVLCSLLPDVGAAPIKNTSGWTNWSWPVCSGLYFPVPVAGRPDQYGLIIRISQLDAAAAAKSSVRLAGGKPVNYGDGGLEKPGDPSANDQTALGRRRSVQAMMGDVATPQYEAVFSCGSSWVSVWAFPSKIATARKAVAELDAALQALGACAAAQKAGAAPPGTFEIGGSSCGNDGAGLRCVVALVGSAGGRELGYAWSVDGRIQAGVTGNVLTVGSITKGKHVIKVRAIDKNTNQPSNVLEIEFIK